MKVAYALAAGAALTLSLGSSAFAADLLGPADPVYSSPLFDFEGLYAGLSGGAAWESGVYGTLGVVVGSNFSITDGLIAGVEFQGDAYFDGSGYTAYDLLALGRFGGFLSENTLLTGDLGAGLLNGSTAYAFGVGLETALTDTISIRGDVQEIGAFGSAPSVTRATVGLMFHMN